MKLIDLINSIGIIILAIGAFIAARGYFLDRDSNIMSRTDLSFGNSEHFESMIYQKYSGICGLFLIMVGSVIQLIPIIFTVSGHICISSFFKIFTYVIFSTIFFLLVHYACKAIVNIRIDLIYLHDSIKMIEQHNNMDDGSKKNNDGAYRYACNRLIKITERRFKKTRKLNLDDKTKFVKQKFRKKFKKIEDSQWIDPYDIN
jgi:hypothetical protein